MSPRSRPPRGHRDHRFGRQCVTSSQGCQAQDR